MQSYSWSSTTSIINQILSQFFSSFSAADPEDCGYSYPVPMFIQKWECCAKQCQIRSRSERGFTACKSPCDPVLRGLLRPAHWPIYFFPQRLSLQFSSAHHLLASMSSSIIYSGTELHSAAEDYATLQLMKPVKYLNGDLKSAEFTGEELLSAVQMYRQLGASPKLLFLWRSVLIRIKDDNQLTLTRNMCTSFVWAYLKRLIPLGISYKHTESGGSPDCLNCFFRSTVWKKSNVFTVNLHKDSERVFV